MATYIKIASNTVGAGGAASVTFSSIPATYTDLVIKVSARSAYSGTSAGLGMQMNGLTTSIYTMKLLAGNGGVPSSNGYSAITFISTDHGLVGSTATASVFSNADIYIPNYLSSNNKSVSLDSVAENNSTAGYTVFNAGLMASTAAITSLTFFSGGSANLAQYSTFTLYGVSNAQGITMADTKIEVNCATGEVIETELTAAEIATRDAEAAAYAAAEAEREAEATAKEAAKADLLAKLGITADEAKLLLG